MRHWTFHCLRTVRQCSVKVGSAYWGPRSVQFRHAKLPPHDAGNAHATSGMATVQEVESGAPQKYGVVGMPHAPPVESHKSNASSDTHSFATDGIVSVSCRGLHANNDFHTELRCEDPHQPTNSEDRVFDTSTMKSDVPAAVAKVATCGENGISVEGGTQLGVRDTNPHPLLASGSNDSATSLEVKRAVGPSPSKIPSLCQGNCQHSDTRTTGLPMRSVSGQGSPTDADRGEASTFSTEEKTTDRGSLSDVGSEKENFVVRDHMRNTVPVQCLLSFEDLANKLPPWLRHGLMRSGYIAPSLVQSVAIPLFMAKHDVVGVAPTGSGKTVAFALPALAALARRLESDHVENSASTEASGDPSEESGRVRAVPHVLVLCPTRELVQQTRRVFSLLSENAVRIAGMYGGQDREQQLEYVRHMGGCDVLVATPGRLCDFVEAREVSLKAVSFLIMDEADRMLELGFAPQLEFLMSDIKRYRRSRQTTMWTATWNATVGGLATRFMQPERLLLEVDREHKVNSNVTQRMYALSDPSQRLQAIVKLYDDGVINRRQQVLIFANRKEEVEWLASELSRALRAPPNMLQFLHGGMRQKRREAMIRGFSCNEVRVLCATDVAARGIDVPGLSHVINYDLPAHVDAYVHRIGRTGRAGRTGTAHTFVTAGDPNAPIIARFIVQQQQGAALPDDVLSIVQDVERCGTAPSRQRYKFHSTVAGKDWRVPANEKQTQTQGSRYVRGVGLVTTLKRPATRK